MERFSEPPVDDNALARLQAAAVDEASRLLVGRRLLPLYGPLHPGTIWVRKHRFQGHPEGNIAPFEQNRDPEPIHAEWATYNRVPIRVQERAPF